MAPPGVGEGVEVGVHFVVKPLAFLLLVFFERLDRLLPLLRDGRQLARLRRAMALHSHEQCFGVLVWLGLVWLVLLVWDGASDRSTHNQTRPSGANCLQ